MTAVRDIAAVWLLFVVAFSWGAATVLLQVFPHGIMRDTVEFVVGESGESASLLGKLVSDFGGRPERFIHTVAFDATMQDLKPLPVSGLRERRVEPRLFLAAEAPVGYRALFGAFDFNSADAFWGAILVGPQGEIVRQWRLSTDDLPGSTEPSYRKNMYGVSMRPDGSILFLMQERGGGIVKVDWCGRRQWAADGIFHHTISPGDNNDFWTFEGQQSAFDHVLTRFDIDTGKVLERIDMADVRRANPNVHIFDLQRQPHVDDRVHGNDIEPLPAALAARFPGFEAGDLLISFRIPNLVFVLEPDTLKIKWWRVGPWDRQHDPDWGADGRISVFSNNERGVGNHSKIVAIDPRTYQTEVLLDGADHAFYSAFNGTHQITPQGGILVTSSHQGRVFELDAEGRIVFDFVNFYDADADEVLHMGDAFFLEPGFFNRAELPTCQ